MQERLWKQAAACHIAHEAYKYGRAQLKPTETKLTWSVIIADEEKGTVKDGKPMFPETITLDGKGELHMKHVRWPGSCSLCIECHCPS